MTKLSAPVGKNGHGIHDIADVGLPNTAVPTIRLILVSLIGVRSSAFKSFAFGSVIVDSYTNNA